MVVAVVSRRQVSRSSLSDVEKVLQLTKELYDTQYILILEDEIAWSGSVRERPNDKLLMRFTSTGPADLKITILAFLCKRVFCVVCFYAHDRFTSLFFMNIHPPTLYIV